MSLIRLFDDIAATRPDQPALVSSRGSLTYGQLRRRVEAVAQRLVASGVGPRAPVGVGAPRSIESVIAVLGILRAGGLYVPIDPNYPPERQRWMATDAGLAALVVASELAPVPEWAATLAIVDCGSSAAEGDDGPALALPEGSPDDLLNILYTSGSTGRPKGVCGTHGAMLNRLRWGWERLPFAAHERVGHRSSLNFVDAGPEIFSGLLRGMPTVVLLPEEQADLGRFVAALEQHRVTRLTVVPSILAALLRSVPELGERLRELRTWITSGEELSLPLLRTFRAAHPSATLINLYGTTEVTGDVTAAIFEPDTPLPDERVPIGAAMADAELLILGARGQLVEDGEDGELYVGGPVLARGYHRRPQEESVRFPQHPLRAERCFRTGDLVRRAPDGALLYLGRVDNLVKIRGIRVELEEIERCLRGACASLRDIAAVLAEGERLVAFVTPADVDLDLLRSTAARLLPAVMIPSEFIPIDALPLLPNGKSDRRALAERIHVEPREIPPERRPRTPSERLLASLWSPLLRRHDIARDDTFTELGGDSLSLAELLAALERTPGASRVELGLAREGTLEAVALALDRAREGSGSDALAPTRAPSADPTLSLTPLGAEGANDPAVVAMVVEASWDSVVGAATELPWRMDEAQARAYCLANEGMVIRLNGEPVGAAIVQLHPNVGEGVEVPAGSVQLEEWLLPRGRGQGILGETRGWPLLADWLAQRFHTEVSVVWEDNVAMLAILRARGYVRAGRSYWTNVPAGGVSEGFCEVWTYDLLPHRRT